MNGIIAPQRPRHIACEGDSMFFRVKCASGKGKDTVLKSASITCCLQSHTHYATVVWCSVKKMAGLPDSGVVAFPTDHQKRSEIYLERGERNHQKSDRHNYILFL